MIWLVSILNGTLRDFTYAHSRQSLLANYDISAGRLWPLILPGIACTPYLFFRLARSRGTATHN